jgi:hypothetical protein
VLNEKRMRFVYRVLNSRGMFARWYENARGWPRVAGGGSLVVAAVGLSLLGAAPAHAVNAQHATVVSDNPANSTPHMADGTVFDFAAAGNRVYAAGSYTNIRNANSNTNLNRRFLVAINNSTGAVDTGFNATLNGAARAVVAAPDGLSIYVGGQFSTVNGVTSRGVVRLDAATGAIWPGWSPVNISGTVEDLKLVGGRLLAGGAFQNVGGSPHPGLVALNPTTGALDPFLNNMVLSEKRVSQSGATSPLKVTMMDVTPDGNKLVIVGNFNRVAGQARGQVAVINLNTNPATLNGWATTRFTPNCGPGAPTYTTGIDISGDGTWMAIVTKGFRGASTMCDTASRFELTGSTANQQPTWINYTGGDTLLSVAITGAAVYVGGHQRWLDNPQGNNSAGPGAVSREGIGAIHPVTGRALAWNPGKTRGIGTQAIFGSANGLWIGSDGNRVAGELHQKVAFFPLP